jgi:Leucine-rich repeat (LRR) protein
MDELMMMNKSIYIDIVGNENYPEYFPKNLGDIINGTGGFTYKNTPLKYISRDDFKDMAPNLYLIILEDNKIEEIPFDTFYDLPDLIYLDVRDNKLKNLAPNLFANSPKFNTLIVESNEIEELHPDLFKDCPEFHVLYAEFNKIEEFHPDLFENNPNMTVISIRHNKIKNIPIDFTRFELLDVADFTHNAGTCDTMYFSFKPYDEYYDDNEQKKWIKTVPEFQEKVEEICRG